MKRAVVLASSLLVVAAVSAQDRTPVRAASSSQGGQGMPSSVTCDQMVSVEYGGGAALVDCTDKSGKSYELTVMDTDHPSATAVIAYVQPYTMAVKLLQSNGGKSQLPSFNQRIAFSLSNGKVTNMTMVTAK
jgi:hypothetical protein